MAIKKNFYLLMVIYILPLAGFGIDIYTPALPHMAKLINTTLPTIKMTVSLYLLGLCLGQIFYGAISDTYGRRPVLLIGSIGFSVLSLIIPFYPSIGLLIGLRILQGFFAGALAVVCRSIIRDVFDDHEIPKSSAYMSIAWSMGPIIAPVIGAYLQYYISWQSNFYFLCVYSLSIFLIAITARETNLSLSKFNPKQFVHDYIFIISNKRLVGLLGIMTVGYSLPVLFSISAPFLIQDALGQNAITYGQSAFWIGFAFLLGTLVNRVVLQFYSSTTLIKFALLGLFIFSLVLLGSSFVFNSLFSLIAPIFFVIMMVGIAFPNCMAKSMSIFPHMAGKVSAVIGAGFMFLTSVVSTIVNYIPIYTQTSLALLFLVLSIFAIIINFKMDALAEREPVLT